MSTNLTKRVLKGDVRALASLMTLIDDDDPRARTVLKAVYPKTGRAHVIGVTGAAGTGKSSLIDRMTAEYRGRQKTVGILAVDPSSAFSNGALLGDRVRMRAHFADAGVFIRSFATRGAKGGVSASIRDAIHLLDAAGKDVIFVETIGVGQDELEIAGLADLVVVVLIPEMGDEVQGMKAGLAEIADILVVNKADLPGADVTVQQLKAIFSDFDILLTSAINHDGVRRLVDDIEKYRLKNLRNGDHHRKRLSLCREELLALLRQRLVIQLTQRIDDHLLDERVQRIAERRVDPYSEVEDLARRLGF
ncbi:MAG: methylmalonyl Co-A mutase-associated GTPase MeaB [Deltaproteobacteria bacterium]|jgi:LAO/AO transport system kinase|nr:MAG: methylmalonyl Co-A mutase-associated GTPase MeaB [Deltaproteobacteria bacterium]